MEFGGRVDFDADVETAYRVLIDPDVLVARCEDAGHKDVEVVKNEASDEGWVLQSKQVIPMDLPGFAKKILSPNNTVVQTDTWEAPDDTGARSGTFEIDVQGAPMKIHGTMTLSPKEGGGSTQELSGSIEVKVPIIGGKIADWAKGDAQRSMDSQLAFNQKWIAEHTS
jgi:hypothetical protein